MFRSCLVARVSEMLYEMTRRFRGMSSTRTDVRNGVPLKPHEVRMLMNELLAAATNQAFANRSVAVNRGRPRICVMCEFTSIGYGMNLKRGIG